MKKKPFINAKIAIIALYTVIPTWHGAADISRLLLKYFPGKRKCLFQMTSAKNQKNHKNVVNINTIINNPIAKLLFLFFLVKKILTYFSDSKKNIIILEGASWSLFSYLIAIIFKKLKKDVIIVYHSHNVDYEVRKLKNSNFILKLTKIFEKKLLSLSDIKTAVSKRDQRLFKKIYNEQTVLLENGVEKIKKKKLSSKLKLPNNYILFPGSYTYYPNKIAIDQIMKIYLNKLSKKFPNYYFVFSGEGLPEEYSKNKKVKYYGILNNNDYFYTLIKSDFIFLPLKNAPGTKLKTLQSLSLNKIILSTKFGFKGIDVSKQNNIFIYKGVNEAMKMISYIIRNKKKILQKSKYNNKYYFEDIVYKFSTNYF